MTNYNPPIRKSEKLKIMDRVENNFTYHKPFGNQVSRYNHLRNIIKQAAEAVVLYCPESRERSIALTKLEEAVMWANASIARNEQGDENGETDSA